MKNMLLEVLFVAFILLVILFIFLYTSHKIITQNSLTDHKPSATIPFKKSEHMTITSAAFKNNGSIPAKYTCDGESINPSLMFENIPSNAKSLVMLMDDPDVPKNIKPDGVFDHWVVYNIPSSTTEIAENSVPQGSSQGLNGAGQEQYTGPCPPDREHRYFFTVYALDSKLQFTNPAKVTKQMVIDKMQGHIIDHAELIGHYNRPQNQK